MSHKKWCEVKEGLSPERWKGVHTKTWFMILPRTGSASEVPDHASLIWICLPDLGGIKLMWALSHHLISLLWPQTKRLNKGTWCISKAFGSPCSSDDLWLSSWSEIKSCVLIFDSKQIWSSHLESFGRLVQTLTIEMCAQLLHLFFGF